ncbi:MAG: ACP S-malonyltransferase [Phycisphaerales bacterium]|nr:ACP S-malonyltransferase [Phycisphaerales bacterium]
MAIARGRSLGSAAIFPGQGSQLLGMGKDVSDAHAIARDTYANADEILGFSLSTLCFDGPPERLNATDAQQPAIFVTSVALFRAALAAGRIKAGQFDILGGLSLGEYTALHLGGALPFESALRLVFRRGQLMQRAAEASPSGMVSVLGLSEEQVVAVCEQASGRGRIAPANFNCPGQIVISGHRDACEAAVAAIDQAGGKAVPLKVAGAFHSEFMKPAADALREELAVVPIESPRTRVIRNVDAEYHGDPASIRDALYRQVFSPVRWQQCVERMIRDGCDEFVEIGPNRVLTGLMRKINRSARAASIGVAGDLNAGGAS